MQRPDVQAHLRIVFEVRSHPAPFTFVRGGHFFRGIGNLTVGDNTIGAVLHEKVSQCFLQVFAELDGDFNPLTISRRHLFCVRNVFHGLARLRSVIRQETKEKQYMILRERLHVSETGLTGKHKMRAWPAVLLDLVYG